jgi:hypothetical protein
MPGEDEVYEDLGREAVRLLKDREGRTAPNEVRDISRDTMEELDDLIEGHFINFKRSEQK